ncbi:hypothetical protein [Mucilaginibacter gotjawali]|uniref:Uncharacterized protein n=1 Tax=Mucilaginibacter gotjawali TaxID=1550579 RepID=A0A839SC25_9SPHI|nr:hypothetical protein [Mucilaginibacter gotjawali]MBB3055751.1 hypothetical protein [Mucilaginibacter gotjawali]
MTKRFEITDQSLKFAFKSPLAYFEDEFTFEEITKKYTRKKSHYLLTLIPGVLCFIGVIITVFSHLYERNGSSVDDILLYCVLSSILLILSALLFENVVIAMMTSGKAITFYANSPSRDEVDGFIALLIAEQKQYLLNRYAKADLYVSTEQLSANLKWLRDRNMIDDVELDELRIKILPKPGGNSSVGFKITPGSN